MKQAYPTFIATQGNDYLVYVPDMDIYTEGKSLADAIAMARDAIGLKGIDLEDSGIPLPQPSEYSTALEAARKDTEDFDYTTGILTMVDVDFTLYRRMLDTKTVRRNVTLPNWLNLEAEKAKLNVSRVLQEALMEKLGHHSSISRR
ncbi:MAG: type II toxin-antitoxin system HicB family antitoxin [Lachnospiraceae bacterium]|nr:type II toxin-antitoxin system HicB family antitoxin [Lachnospiraceae bacterium]